MKCDMFWGKLEIASDRIVPIVAIECERCFKSFLLQNAHDSYVIKDLSPYTW